MGPIVSILIPTRNRPNLLLKAVKSALSQTYSPIEIIISDNSDNDQSREILALINEDNIRYSKNPENIGPILNWRKALEIAAGEYCIILPDDDYLINPFYIEDAVNILLNDNIQLVVPDCILSYPSKNIIGVSGFSGQINGKDFIESVFNIPHIGNVFRRSMALHLNAFHSNDILWSDIELWIKLLSEGDVFCYCKPSISYLFHHDNIVLNMSKSELIINSRFILPAVAAFANKDLIPYLVLRYLYIVDSISRKVDSAFVRSVIKLNDVSGSIFVIMFKIKFQRLKRKIIRKLVDSICKCTTLSF